MPKLLITGFDPFNGADINPAWEAVRLLPEQVGTFQVHKLQIPTVYGKASDVVLATAREWEPDVILCVGQAGGRDAVTPERIAVNIRSATIADNAGNTFDGQRVDPLGDAAYFATVPVDAMAGAIRAAEIPGKVSNSAGTFVCNDTLYRLLMAYHGSTTRVGFIHVPYLPEQGEPNLPLKTTVRALEAAICAMEPGC